MYARKSHKLVSGLMVLAGILVCALRLAVTLYCTDQRGLVPPLHPMGLGIWAVAALALALALVYCLRLKVVEEYKDNFPPELLRFLGHVLVALGILATVLFNKPHMQGSLRLAWTVLGVASVPCLLVAGWLRFRGKQPLFVLHLCPGLFLVAHTISQYQTWSSDPQLLNYIFSLLGAISMIFFAFYQSAFDVGLIWRRKLTFFGLTTVMLGLASILRIAYPWLNLGMVLWALIDCPAPAPRRRRRNPITEGDPE